MESTSSTRPRLKTICPRYVCDAVQCRDVPPLTSRLASPFRIAKSCHGQPQLPLRHTRTRSAHSAHTQALSSHRGLRTTVHFFHRPALDAQIRPRVARSILVCPRASQAPRRVGLATKLLTGLVKRRTLRGRLPKRHARPLGLQATPTKTSKNSARFPRTLPSRACTLTPSL